MTTGEPASPVCYAPVADDIYMGYADRAELIAGLAALLAGARWLAARDASGDMRHWCSMLQRELARLGGVRPADLGADRGRAEDRAALIGRLGNFLPRVRDEALHRRLREMRDALVAG